MEFTVSWCPAGYSLAGNADKEGGRNFIEGEVSTLSGGQGQLSPFQ
ncbi:hypothetical protein [Sporomusa sp.]|nr:hypothetical protein [Sporomusa sp.]HWR09604.1 hypothetical protein [Sporomusa sp.]